MRSRIWNAAALCVTAFQAHWVIAQWSFELDTTFRTQILEQNVNALHVLQDGKIFASGRIRFPGDLNERGSARLYMDGQRDATYTGFFGGEKILPWVNGKFYVSNGLPRRMMPDGNTDQSFIALYNGPYFQSSTTGDYHVFPDGRVLISGSHLLSDSIRGFEGTYELIWFTNTGYLDTTRVHRNANGPIWDFKELPNGQFICTCNCSMYDGQSVSKLFRVNADLTLDTSFQPGVNWGNIFAYHGLPDGRVHVGGRFKRTAAPNDTLYLARFLPDGSLDPTFNNANALSITDGITSTPKVTNIVPWQADKLFVMGVLREVNEEQRGGICVLDTSGAPLPLMEDCLADTFKFVFNAAGNFNVNASIHGIAPAQQEGAYYIWGTYTGYSDGTTNDTLQRFVSRLLVTDLGTQVREHAAPALRLYPNPAGATATLELEALPRAAHAVLRDALGRVVLQQPLRAHATTLDLQTLSDGIYILELRANNERTAVQRLVVQH